MGGSDESVASTLRGAGLNEEEETGDELTYSDSAGMALLASGVLVIVGFGAWLVMRSPGVTGGGDLPLMLLSLLSGLCIALAVVLWIGVGFVYMARRRAFYDRVRFLNARAVQEAVTDLGNGLTLEKLYVLNRRQLDEYHMLSVRQASIAFRNATIAAILAFTILVAGAIQVVQLAQDDAGRYIAGGLSALGAGLSAFVAAVFFRSYDKTSAQLREYYEEPARTGRILASERLARTQCGDESDSDPSLDPDLRRMIVERLLAPPGPPAPRMSPAESVRGAVGEEAL